MARKSGIIGYGIVFGLGIGLGYMMFSQQTATASPPPAQAAQSTVGTRWTSGYHGSFATGFPEAMVAESLFGRNQMHKQTAYTPGAYEASMAVTNGSNGSIIYVD